MAVVKYLDNSIECAKALKGDDYVHLLDSNGNMIAAFDGISDFSGFSISGGSWATPTADHYCYLAVMKDDGTIGKGGHKCSDVLPKSGGMMTGALHIKGDYNGVYLDGDDGSIRSNIIALPEGDKNYARIGVRAKNTNFNEYYSTPRVSADLSANKWYEILTTKNPVTIAQGGTDATTADKARANLGLGVVNICDRVIKNAGVDGVSVEVPVSENLHNFSRIAFAFQDGTSSPVYPRIPGFTRHSVHNGSKSAEFEESAEGNSIKCTQQTADAIVIGIFGWR